MTYNPLAISIDPPRGRDGLWKLVLDIDEQGPWTFGDIQRGTNLNRGTVHEFLTRLRKGGLLQEVGTKPGRLRNSAPIPLFRVLRRVDETPVLDRQGRPVPELGIDTMWRTIKMLKAFTLDELLANTVGAGRPIKRTTAACYLKALSHAGVLAQGGTMHHPSYRLVRNVGKRAPKILATKAVYDPNSNAVIGSLDTREVAP